MMDQPGYNCPFCFYRAFEFSTFTQHVIRSHKDHPNFIAHCTADGCEYSSKNWKSFKAHCSRQHGGEFTWSTQRNEINPQDDNLGDPEQFDIPPEDDLEYIESVENISTYKQKKLHAGKYALQLDAGYNLPQKAVDGILETTDHLVHDQISLYKSEIEKALKERNLPTDFLSDIPIETLFDDVSTVNRRNNVYKDDFNYIAPRQVELGKKWCNDSKGNLIQKPKYGYIVPFKESLQQFVRMPEVWESISKPHPSKTDIKRDICDGMYFQNHPVFSTNPNALQIIFNTDDLELVNALGSHIKKHKLSMFYYILANIPPEMRSSLNVIQLVAVAKNQDIHDIGPELLLRDFIDTMSELATQGIQFEIDNRVHTIPGGLLLVPCDTPAAGWLAGMKEGVGFAEKACRGCNGSKNTDMKTKFRLEAFYLRTDEEHAERCDRLENFGQKNRRYWSRSWGINKRSCFMEIPQFTLELFVQDPMHVMLEGVIPQEMALFLHTCINEQKFFSRNWLNARILTYSYSYLQKSSKPERIEKCHIDNGQIKQSSSGMLTLCEILPFILAAKVPSDNPGLVCLLRLLQITQIVLSPVCTSTTPTVLADLIEIHHEQAITLYGNSIITPKCHYMVHFPRQMKLFGPLRHHWVMRMEAKHHFFTSRKTRNFRNLPKTSAVKHQKHMCHQMTTNLGQPHSGFLYSGDVVKEGTKISVSQEEPEVAIDYTLKTGSDGAYATTCLEIHGHVYKPGCALVILYQEDDTPVFGIVTNILVKDKYKMFVVEIQETEYFDTQVLAYAVFNTKRKVLVQHSKLSSRWPLSTKFHNGTYHIVNKYSHIIESI